MCMFPTGCLCWCYQWWFLDQRPVVFVFVCLYLWVCVCVGSSCQLSSTRPAYRRSSWDSQKQDECGSGSGGHWPHGHRPVGEFWRVRVFERWNCQWGLTAFSSVSSSLQTSSILSHCLTCSPLWSPSSFLPSFLPSFFPSLLRSGLTALEVCRVTSQLWRRWLSSHFFTQRSLTTLKSSLPGDTHTHTHAHRSLIHFLKCLDTETHSVGRAELNCILNVFIRITLKTWRVCL